MLTDLDLIRLQRDGDRHERRAAVAEQARRYDAARRRAMLSEMPTDDLIAELQRRGCYVEPPASWPRMADDE